MTSKSMFNKYGKYLVTPIALLLVVLLYVYWISNTMVPRPDFDPFRILQKSLVMILILILIIVSQRFLEHRIPYLCIIIGLSMLLFGEIENVLDELYNINYPWPAIDFEDLNALGLLLVGLGLFVYTNLLHRIRLRTEQSKRETELYATLLRHDLRNDLQAVMGYIEMAESDENPKALLESAKMATLRMSRLVKTFSLDIESQDDELIPLIVQTARDAEKTHSGLKIKLSIDANASNTRAYGLSLIQIALENIFRNSSQYCGKNPIVDVNVRKVGGLIEILVSDNGPGIPEELRKRIFSRGISTNEGGLGLYLASTILKGCGGSIELLDSQKGTQFKLLIPIKQ